MDSQENAVQEAETAETININPTVNLLGYSELMRFFCCIKLSGIDKTYQNRKNNRFVCEECYDIKLVSVEQVHCQRLINPHVGAESPHILNCYICKTELFAVCKRAQDCTTCRRVLIQKFRERNALVENPENDSNSEVDSEAENIRLEAED